MQLIIGRKKNVLDSYILKQDKVNLIPFILETHFILFVNNIFWWMCHEQKQIKFTLPIRQLCFF